MSNFFIDRKYRLPRIWSNRELEKFSSLFSGDIVNVSGWKDLDKEGRYYRDYFVNAASYTITNFNTDERGFQGYENEIFLNLENQLPSELFNRFDVVFNHTVLEHVFDVNIAFKNLIMMSKDIVILVVPFLQQMHASYGDYWRFTPLTIKKMLENNGMSLLYLSFNSHKDASVYIFSIATKNLSSWSDKIPYQFSYLDNKPTGDGFENYIGCHAIQNNLYTWKSSSRKIIDNLFGK